MKRIFHLQEIIAPVEGVICDLWGVVHDGRRVFASALDALKALRKRAVPVIVVSNSPRPSANVAAQVKSLGAEGEWCDFLLTSGDLAREHMAKLGAGSSFFHLGPPRDHPTLEGLPNPKVNNPKQANVILCTGFFEDRSFDLSFYREMLKEHAKAGKPLVCANPDKAVSIGGRPQPCAGAIAEIYAEMGGPVVWLGKPEKIVYQRCLDLISEAKGKTVGPQAVLAIGDNLETDILGAQRMGMITLFVTDGLHAKAGAGSRELETLVEEAGVRPGFVMERLVW